MEGGQEADAHYQGVGFQEAVKLLGSVEPLSRNTRPPAPSPKAPDLSPSTSENPPFAGHYYKYFVPSDWLATRGLEARTLERFGVGEYNNPARQNPASLRRWKIPSSSVISLATQCRMLIRNTSGQRDPRNRSMPSVPRSSGISNCRFASKTQKRSRLRNRANASSDGPPGGWHRCSCARAGRTRTHPER